MYRELGLQLQHIDNPIEAGIMEVRRRMRSGRLKVFPSLVKYLAESRVYRRDGNDQVVRDRDNLQDATRSLVNGLSQMIAPPREEEEEEFRFSDFPCCGPGAWMR
jgi:hypothetical protein